MARLINPGTGEILDRLSILGLKLLYGGLAGKETKHFRDERNVLLTKLNAGDGITGPAMEHYIELAAVNAALWQAEDQLREYRDVPQTAHVDMAHYALIVRCAFKIQQLNDRRAELISLINVNTGEAGGQEKLT